MLQNQQDEYTDQKQFPQDVSREDGSDDDLSTEHEAIAEPLSMEELTAISSGAAQTSSHSIYQQSSHHPFRGEIDPLEPEPTFPVPPRSGESL